MLGYCLVSAQSDLLLKALRNRCRVRQGMRFCEDTRLLDDSLSDHESYDVVMSTDDDGSRKKKFREGKTRVL